jgi:hypothetical protein
LDHSVIPKLAVFGDSHYACVKQAHNLGLVDLSGIDVEYWGHVGGRFHFLESRDGAIYPKDDFTAARFAKFNEKGRQFLPAADFDMVFFMGARITVMPFVAEFIRAKRLGIFMSSGLKRRMARDQMTSKTAYGFAKDMAATKTAHIVVAPVSFTTFADLATNALITAETRAGSAEDRAEAWQLLCDVAAEDGITLIPQPDETVVDCVFTRSEYAVESPETRKDYTHRNAAYGAIVFKTALDLIRSKVST